MPSAAATAVLSFTAPQSPPGSAAVTAIPASIGAPNTRAHSSGVKLSFKAMISLPFSARRWTLADLGPLYRSDARSASDGSPVTGSPARAS